jgi:hypothetical protein
MRPSEFIFLWVNIALFYVICGPISARRNVTKWAVKQGYRLIEVRYTLWRSNPGCAAYRVILENINGATRQVWVYSGYPLTMEHGTLYVQWKDEDGTRTPYRIQ